MGMDFGYCIVYLKSVFQRLDTNDNSFQKGVDIKVI